MLPPGTLVGRYVITGVLGHGGMGVVYAAHDPDLDRPLAIKLLRRELRTARARLLREGQAIAKLTHPNVVVVHDVGTHGDDLFIAMERVRGQTLGGWIRSGGSEGQPWRDVLEHLIPAGRGLAAAHADGLGPAAPADSGPVTLQVAISEHSSGLDRPADPWHARRS